jgi:hypothetical protein
MKGIWVMAALVLAACSLYAQVSADSSRKALPGRPEWRSRSYPDSLHGRGRDADLSDRREAGRGYRDFRYNHSGRGAGGSRFSPEQRKQMMAIQLDYHQKQRELYQDDRQTLGHYKDQLLALDKERRAKMEALLTPAQKPEVERRRKRRSEEAQVRTAARVERIKIHLNLTDQQAAFVKAVQEKSLAEASSIRENEDLLPDQKREQFKALADRQKESLKSVLTADQFTEWENMHKDRLGAR